YVDNFKRKFADQEFNAIKRRSRGQIGQKCTCIVTVMKEVKNVKRTVIKSVVGTLDLSIRYMLHGETFPGERVRTPLFCSINRTDPNKYGYIANLCVIKSARRRGIASNMLHFAVESAKSEIRSLFSIIERRKEKEKLSFMLAETVRMMDELERFVLVDPNIPISSTSTKTRSSQLPSTNPQPQVHKNALSISVGVSMCGFGRLAFYEVSESSFAEVLWLAWTFIVDKDSKWSSSTKGRPNMDNRQCKVRLHEFTN
ncbi:hypothetical protein SO802_009875, partial [Lithocarpus litseifolius]